MVAKKPATKIGYRTVELEDNLTSYDCKYCQHSALSVLHAEAHQRVAHRKPAAPSTTPAEYFEMPSPEDDRVAPKTSPFPWRASPSDGKRGSPDGIHSADGCNVANLESSVAPNAANMALIVLRVNQGPAFDALARAVEEMVNASPAIYDMTPRQRAAYDKVREKLTALKLAQEVR